MGGEHLVNEETTRKDFENVSEAREGDETSDGLSPLQKAEKAIEDLKEQNRVMSNNLERLEQVKATKLLGGTALAGKTVEKKVEQREETPQEYAKRVMTGEV